MKSFVSRVACMRLLGGVQLPLEPARGASMSPPPGSPVQLMPCARPPHNARHHPPPRAIANDDSRRVGGRVHAVVRFRSSLDRAPLPYDYADDDAPERALISKLQIASSW